MVVIEGNRRLAAIKEIRAHPERYKEWNPKLDQIPVLVFPDKSDGQKNDMRVYLGVRHLFGFREWPPISKAQFLERESEAIGDLDRVLKEVRLTKQQARRFLLPLRLLKAANAQLPRGEDFWVLGEALQRSGVKDYLQLEVDPKTLKVTAFDKKNFNFLLNDLYGQKRTGTSVRDAATRVVSDTRDLSRLSRVLGSQKAAVELRKGKTLDEAEIFVDSKEESIARLKSASKELTVIIKKILKGARDGESAALLKASKEFDTAVRAYLKKNAKSFV